MNRVDHYPNKAFQPPKKRVDAPCVWDHSLDWNEDVRGLAFDYDTRSPNFDLSFFIKDKDDANEIKNVLRRNMDLI